MAPAASAVRSIPEQKARPAPRTTTTNVAASPAARSTHSARAAASAVSSALSTDGRLRVIQLTPSRAS